MPGIIGERPFQYNRKEVARIQTTDTEQLFRLYGNTIWRIALNYTRNAADADDVMQNTLLRCIHSAPAFESEDHRRNWVLRVAINESKRWLAHPWHRLMASACQPDETPLPAAELNPRQQALYRALLLLPEKYRVPLYLFYYEDRTAAQIAEMLGLSVSGVTTRLDRGRSKLKKQLEGEFFDD